MSEVEKLNLVREYWKLSDEALRDEFERMSVGFSEQWTDSRVIKIVLTSGEGGFMVLL